MAKEQKSLCASHITKLLKVTNQLSLKQKINYTQLILNEKNNNIIKEAQNLIDAAIKKLDTIK